MTIYCPDLSNNNGSADSIDFAAMRRGGCSGVILKATEGTGFVDPRFGIWVPRALAAGLYVAAYHFLHPEQPVATQVGLFERTIALPGVGFHMCDAETDPAQLQAAADAFCPAALVRVLYSGAYLAGTVFTQPIPGVEWLLAAYGQPAPPIPPWGKRAGWQFTDHASVPGVPGPCDLSIFDPTCWAELTGGGPVPQATDVTGSFVPPSGHPNAGSAWEVNFSGAVFTIAGTAFYGSYGSLPPQVGTRNFVAITARPDGKPGYVIWGNDGSWYTFGPGPNAGVASVITHLGEEIEVGVSFGEVLSDSGQRTALKEAEKSVAPLTEQTPDAPPA